MPDHSAATRVSLPSIHQMLPEYMLQIPPEPPHGFVSPFRQPYAPAVHPRAVFPETSARRTHDHRADPYPSRHLPELASEARAIEPSAHATWPVSIPRPDARPLSPSRVLDSQDASALGSASHSPSVSLHTPAPYSFDVLRPHPLTADLETVASSTNAAVPPRIPTTGAFPTPGALAPGAHVSAIQKAKPAFRVNPVPTSPVAQHTADLVRCESDYTPRSDDGRPSSYPPFAANQYLSEPSSRTLMGFEGMYRQDVPSAQADDKKHRCPHCNKRFNRPSSLNIHVNTHTGAKPFVCPYAGCNRKFNVNSNMRRHYRNHLTSSRRRDVVARYLQPASPSPPPSLSATSSPQSPFDSSLPSASSYRSSSFSDSHSDVSDDEESTSPIRAGMQNLGMSPSFVKQELALPESRARETHRLRSRSSPVPRFREEPYPRRADMGGRHRSHSCAVAGCECISTALRPAFPESTAPSSSSMGAMRRW